MATTLPLVGVAAEVAQLPLYADWLLADQRPVELSDTFVNLPRIETDGVSLVREAKSALDGYTGHLGIHGPFISLPLNAADVRIRQVVADRFVQALEFGAELGARHMVVHSPFTIFGHPLVEHSPINDLQYVLDATHATLERPLALAKETGCTLVIETIHDLNPTPLCALVSSFDEGVQLSMDVGHTLITEQFGGMMAHDWVRMVGPLLGHLHLQDGDGVVDRHWLPGQGRLNWWALFEALRRSPADPVVIIEVRDGLTAAEWLISRGYVR